MTQTIRSHNTAKTWETRYRNGSTFSRHWLARTTERNTGCDIQVHLPWCFRIWCSDLGPSGFQHELEALPGDSEWSPTYCHGLSPHGQHWPHPQRDESAAFPHSLWSVDEAIYASMSFAWSSTQQRSQRTSTIAADDKWSRHSAPASVSSLLNWRTMPKNVPQSGECRSYLRDLHTTCKAQTVAGCEHNIVLEPWTQRHQKLMRRKALFPGSLVPY